MRKPMLTLVVFILFISSFGLFTQKSDAQQADCSKALSPRLIVKGRADVIPQPPLPLNVRDNAGKNAKLVAKLAPGTQFTVIAGPSCVDGIYWWQIKSDAGVTGWVAEGTDSYYVEPLPAATAAPLVGTAAPDPAVATMIGTAIPTPLPPVITSYTTGVTSGVIKPSITSTLYDTKAYNVLAESITWSPDNKLIATAFRDSVNHASPTTLLTADDKLVTQMSGPSSFKPVADAMYIVSVQIAWSPDGKYLASTSGDNKVFVWTSAGKAVTNFAANYSYAMTWTPNSKQIVLAIKGKLTVWDLNGQPSAIWNQGGKCCTALAWSPNGQYIAAAGGTDVFISDAQGKPVASFDGFNDFRDAPNGPQESALSWSADSTQLAYFSGNGDIHIANVVSKSTKIVSSGGLMVTSLAWSPDGTLIAAIAYPFMGEDGAPALNLYDGQGNPVAQVAVSGNDLPYSLVWSADSKKLLGARGLGYIVFTLRD